MRFADLDGSIIDVYQAATQLTDESGQDYPFTVDPLLDRALGAEGFYGAFVANIHTDFVTSLELGSHRRLRAVARRPGDEQPSAPGRGSTRGTPRPSRSSPWSGGACCLRGGSAAPGARGLYSAAACHARQPGGLCVTCSATGAR